MTKEHFLGNLWLWKCGLREKEVLKFDMDDLSKTQWSDKFEQYMRNRMILGGVRYGKLVLGSKPKFDQLKEVTKRINRYKETGNQEYLVDAANYCMCEFMQPSLDNVYFKAIDDGEHTEEI